MESRRYTLTMSNKGRLHFIDLVDTYDDHHIVESITIMKHPFSDSVYGRPQYIDLFERCQKMNEDFLAYDYELYQYRLLV